MQPKEAIARFVSVMTEIETLNEDLKAIKEEAKESGLNVAVLAAVAKAIVTNKVDELKEKSADMIDAIDLSRS